MGKAKRQQRKYVTTERMNRKAKVSAKSQDLQLGTQTDTVATQLLLPSPM